MKMHIAAVAASFLLSSCAWHNVGNLTVASTHNVDRDLSTYTLLVRDVDVRVKARRNPLQVAIDRGVASRPGGEYMMNVMVYMKPGNTKKVKLTGDVYGRARPEGVAPATDTRLASDLAVGDRVAVRMPGKVVSGVVIGLQPEKAMVEYDATNSKGEAIKRMKAFAFDRVTKIHQ